MSQMRQGDPLLAVLLLLVFFSLAGCGSPSGSSSFNSDSGHPAGWLPAGHKTEAVASMESCTQCHGADYAGGISRISCTSCHMGGVASMHPPWGTPDYAAHGSYVKNNGNDTSGCANISCHGTTLTGVSGSGPSCTSCHMGDVASIHPPWGTPAYALHGTYVKSNSSDTSGCANATCHGTALTGVSGSGPSCTLCHMGSAVSVHPVEWNGDVMVHKTKVGFTNIESCKNIVCHGAALEGVSLSGPSCYICH